MTSYLFSPFENPESNLLLDSVLRDSKGENILMLARNSKCLLCPEGTQSTIDTHTKPGKSTFYCDEGVIVFSYMTNCVSFDMQVRCIVSSLEYIDIEVKLKGGFILLGDKICGQYEKEVFEQRSVLSGTLVLEKKSAQEYCKYSYLPFEVTSLKEDKPYINRPLLVSSMRQAFECEFGKGRYLDANRITG